MIKRFQYITDEERSLIIADNKHLYLIKEENLFEGNFLTFTSAKPVSVEIEELNQEKRMLKFQVEALTQQGELLEGAIVELASLTLD